MKKFFAIILTISMLVLAAMPVLAEEADAAPEQAQTQEAPEARRGRTRPRRSPSRGEAPRRAGPRERPERSAALSGSGALSGSTASSPTGQQCQRPMDKNGQFPMRGGKGRMNGQNGIEGPEGEPDQMPNQNQMPTQNQQPMDKQNGMNNQNGRQGQQGQRPMDKQNGKNGKNGQRPMDGEKFVDFDALVKQGVITQETRDKIDAYMKENAPEAPEAPADGEAPESPAQSARGSRRRRSARGPADGEQPDLLADLLSNGVITQAEYDAITAAQTNARINRLPGSPGSPRLLL